MAEESIKEQIKQLVKLQALDTEIYGLQKNLKDNPHRLQGLKEQFEGKKAKLKSLEDEYKGKQVARNALEVDLKAKEDGIAKANAQLSQIKTNKEYTAKITEIENIKADKSIIEEKILTSYDETDAVKNQIDAEKANLAQEEQVYLKEKAEIENIIRTMEQRIQALQAQRQGILPAIDKKILSKYEKILINREGEALVPLSGTACGGCNMNVPPQVINEIKMYKELISCELCARILYIALDLQ